jgi:hypothetical protein
MKYKYTFPPYIQAAIAKANRAELELLKDKPELRFFVRDVESGEPDALEYQSLFEPEDRRGCAGCARYAVVVVSPEHKERLHFFTSRLYKTGPELETIAKGLSMLVRAETEEDWGRLRKLIFDNPTEAVPFPIEYSTTI